MARFDPPVSVYQRIEQQLETITDEADLTQLLAAAIRAESMGDFQTTLAQNRRPNASQ
ncbi:MAG TPA: hypothetical protein VIH59_36855 [Candidatus Tectomicrobia bacterium]